MEQLVTLLDRINGFDTRCRRLPRKLREWQAYRELRQTITEFQEILPLLTDLSRDCVKKRHWMEVQEVCSVQLTMEGEMFKMRELLDTNLVVHKDAIEDICDSAEKQAQIEAKLADVRHKWGGAEFDLVTWRNREIYILSGYGQIMEDLEESQLTLQTMLSMRHVTPFRDSVAFTLTQLSEISDTLELWVKVQTLWCSLESVFTSGDIAKQMPQDAKKFSKIDKDWAKLMTRAEETRNVVAASSNEVLRNSLPLLHFELEKCQKSLEGYLEQKRSKFPRFYFVSNLVLLQILSQGSDPLSIQPYYEKIFDAIDRVVHDRGNVRSISHILNIMGKTKEEITLLTPVNADGNIEDWCVGLWSRVWDTYDGASICA